MFSPEYITIPLIQNMKFIDSAKIYLKPGDGGNGCLSYYYRGKKRFPSGGNGGIGGSVYLLLQGKWFAPGKDKIIV